MSRVPIFSIFFFLWKVHNETSLPGLCPVAPDISQAKHWTCLSLPGCYFKAMGSDPAVLWELDLASIFCHSGSWLNNLTQVAGILFPPWIRWRVFSHFSLSLTDSVDAMRACLFQEPRATKKRSCLFPGETLLLFLSPVAVLTPWGKDSFNPQTLLMPTSSSKKSLGACCSPSGERTSLFENKFLFNFLRIYYSTFWTFLFNVWKSVKLYIAYQNS